MIIMSKLFHGKYFACQIDYKNVTRIVEVETEAIITINNTSSDEHRLQFLPNNEVLAIATKNGVEFWSLVESKIIRQVTANSHTGDPLRFLPNFNKLVCWTADGINVWDLDTNTESKLVPNSGEVIFTSYVISSDDKLAFDSNGGVYIYDLKTCKQIRRIDQAWFVHGFSSDGKMIVLCHRNFQEDYITRLSKTQNGEMTEEERDEYFLGVWSVDTGKCIRKYTNNNDPITRFNFFADNNTFLTVKSAGANSITISKLQDCSQFALETTVLLRKSVAAYVVRDIINFITASKESTDFDTEDAFMSYEKIKFIQKLYE